MDIGVVLQTTPPSRRVVDLAKKADSFGFSHVWTFDSHILWQEPYVIYSQILAETRNVVVGPMVTNPYSRHPAVLAGIMATLQDASGGGLPATIFTGNGEALIYFLAIAGAQQGSAPAGRSLLPFNTCALIGPGLDASASTVYLEAADGSDKPLKLVRGPVQFDSAPVETTRSPIASEHTELVLMEIGIEWDKIEEYKAKGAIA